MLEDQLKELFEELNIERRPRTFGAVDVIHHGQEVKSRRRALTVAGSALGTTALVVAVGFALAGLPASGHDPATPPGPAGTSTHTPSPHSSPAEPSLTDPTGGPTTAPTPTADPGGTTPPHPHTTASPMWPTGVPDPTASDVPQATTGRPGSPLVTTALPSGVTTGSPGTAAPHVTAAPTTTGPSAPTTRTG